MQLLLQLPLLLDASLYGMTNVYQIFSDNPQETIFDSQQCMGSPKMFHAYTVTITVGYLLYDLFLSLFVV